MSSIQEVKVPVSTNGYKGSLWVVNAKAFTAIGFANIVRGNPDQDAKILNKLLATTTYQAYELSNGRKDYIMFRARLKTQEEADNFLEFAEQIMVQVFSEMPTVETVEKPTRKAKTAKVVENLVAAITGEETVAETVEKPVKAPKAPKVAKEKAPKAPKKVKEKVVEELEVVETTGGSIVPSIEAVEDCCLTLEELENEGLVGVTEIMAE